MLYQPLIDSRESKPYRIIGAKYATLETGDYSIEGLTDKFAIERKSLTDAWGSISKGHERFRREMERAAGFLDFVILVEGLPEEFMNPQRYNCQVHPNALRGTVIKWREDWGIRWVFRKNKGEAQKWAEWRLKAWFEEYQAGLWKVEEQNVS